MSPALASLLPALCCQDLLRLSHDNHLTVSPPSLPKIDVEIDAGINACCWAGTEAARGWSGGARRCAEVKRA